MPVQTVQSAARRVRRLDRLNNGVEFVLDQMRAGASLRCTHRSSSTLWTLSTGFAVSASVANLYQIPLIRTRGPIGAVRWT